MGALAFLWSSQLLLIACEYDALIHLLTIPGTIKDAREIYWDMRLSSRFKTVEVRIADVCLTVEETVVLAGLVRALVQTCHERVLRNEPFLPIRPEALRIAHWQAARYGLDATLLDPLSERMLPARQLLEQFLQFVRPALKVQDDWETVSNTVETIVQKGTGQADSARSTSKKATCRMWSILLSKRQPER